MFSSILLRDFFSFYSPFFQTQTPIELDDGRTDESDCLSDWFTAVSIINFSIVSCWNMSATHNQLMVLKNKLVEPVEDNRDEVL